MRTSVWARDRFPTQLPTKEEPPVEPIAYEILYDGSGKHPAEPSYRCCGCRIAGENASILFPLLGCWQSVSGHCHTGVIVTDCKGASTVTTN
eukprot:330482-Amphidinium_carterae.2